MNEELKLLELLKRVAVERIAVALERNDPVLPVVTRDVDTRGARTME